MGIEWTGKSAGGRTYVANGKAVFVIEKMRHGRRYTTPLEVSSEREALAELALFERDPEAYLTRAQAKERRAAEAVYMTAENVKRFSRSGPSCSPAATSAPCRSRT